MEIDCTGTVFAKYFGKVCDQVSLGCPGILTRKSDRLVREYNKKPQKYHRNVNQVVRDVKGRVSQKLQNLNHKNEHRNSRLRASEMVLNEPVHRESDETMADSTADNDDASEFQFYKTGLYYLGAGVGALGVGALASVGLVALGAIGCTVYCIEKLLCVDPEYEKELKALEVENVYRPDVNNVPYLYRSPYRY
ncbi:hypothetical protein MACJ_001428 [Theileria orientalis]|uniref:Uncharacterized protein n=1 Tax=Theileria orientalis TaxID=68886 RepID=A0A976MA56_THEOR|nr:hypothetical protein MACJ_001428 [Theileria orientalis]